ncbi:MAG: peptide chain release factor N(5)-glutamine methyltransferase [Clostridia bacterium]|nr:peptide chain release factor N(5)-glutamine methyltransferase [Clostridia bacterium]
MRIFEAIEILQRAGIESAEQDARELYRAFGTRGGIGYLERSLDAESERFDEAVRRRALRIPLQYIVGSVGFYREEYEVTQDVLIPRPDTEHLVDYAVHMIPEGESFIDICTGSGCIAISTLRNTRGTTAVGVDISEAALAVAKRNAERLGVGERLELKLCDVLSEGDGLSGSYYAVLSNPPYVTEAAYEGLEPEIYHEPKCAFVGGEDGMTFYKAIIPIAKRIMKPEGFIAFEIGYDQKEAISSLAEKEEMSAEIIKDFSGNDRVAILRYKR